MHKLLLLRNN